MLNFTILFWGLPSLSNLINCFTIVDIKYTCIAYKIYITMACCNTTTTSLVTFPRTVAFYQQLVQSGTQEYKGEEVIPKFVSRHPTFREKTSQTEIQDEDWHCGEIRNHIISMVLLDILLLFIHLFKIKQPQL